MRRGGGRREALKGEEGERGGEGGGAYQPLDEMTYLLLK